MIGWVVAVGIGAQLYGAFGTAGLSLGGGVGVGVVGADVVSVLELQAGIETAPFSLHLRAPLTLRLLDQAPAVSPASPSWCQAVRCEELLRGQDVDPVVFARIVDEIRIFRPGDALHARVGRLAATLGAGAVVDRVTTTASWDRRTSGAYAGLRLDQFRADLVVADVTSPLELVAGRFEFAAVGVPVVVGGEAAADLWAPVGRADDGSDDNDDADDATRLLATTSLDVRLPVVLGAVSVAPRLELAGTTGLLPRDTASAEGGPLVGAGIAGGVDATFRASFFEARTLGVISLGSPGHRRGLFSTLHLVERRQALAGSAVTGGGLVDVPAPGGAGVDLRLDVNLAQVVTTLTRLHIEPAPGANAAEVGVVVELEPISVSVSAIRRAFVDPAGILDVDFSERPLVVAAEAAWRIWGPLSVWARWYRLPRTRGAALVFDDDVLAGVALAGVWRPS